ncbi:(2Fe-2S)-binding protein [Mastigocoleus sp. MO_188.B34]|uniref:(2Fe-2S)-binding protein n=1 Tax=Mastigocoleus sp. MO_188.B34 TaxID=3036635 RepID=UPI00262F9F92|nr:(2Fe-2S)-binding protein [Mastigocoleus sp. MO_188.B34]MDJ0694572.1 (2Fe-2S)-binding protein [Mastigocoleus sp. MO_188.B34]
MFKRLSELNGNTVTVNIEGEDVQVAVGETVAAAVLVHNLGYTRTTPISGSNRAPLCMMGVCFECLMEIDGLPNRQACQVLVAEGMRIRRQQGVAGDG